MGHIGQVVVAFLSFFTTVAALAADQGNRLAYVDDFCNPYYVGLDTAKLTTPQWIGEPGVEAAIVLSIDDMRDTATYENFLRPIIERLKKIDGRGPYSIMTNRVDPDHPHLQVWLKEGVSIETHTAHHPCPCLQGSNLEKAKATFDECVDLLHLIPNTQPVGFRMPCCDSMNSSSPRFYTEIFGRTTPGGKFVRLDSSVFLLFTPADPELPRDLVLEPDGRQRFAKYIPHDRLFTNYVRDYTYPFVIDRLCWEMPSAIPDDWLAFNRYGPHHADMLRDMKAVIDATVVKKGVFTLTHHPGAWIRNDQVVELIDHAVNRYGTKVKFLSFRDLHERLTANLLGGHPLRAINGQDNGVRVLDVNNDGYMDAVIGNEQTRRTRIWSPATGKWVESDLPVPIVTVDAEGNRRDAGVRFGVLRPDGQASIVVRNGQAAGVWHFDNGQWVSEPQGLAGLDVGGVVHTSLDGRDRGVRLRDLDGDGLCELIVGNPAQSAVFRWRPAGGWERLPFGLPDKTTIVNDQGRDAGLRFADPDVDSHPDVIFSDGERYGVYRFVSMSVGWSQTMISGRRGDTGEIPPIVRADGTNNGVWFKDDRLWVQNEETGGKLPGQVDSRHYTDLLGTDREPPVRTPQESLKSFRVLDGFKVELVAAEPLVIDPADIAWGPDGKMWIVEYSDYPLGLENKGIPCGRIRYLEDTDGDGRYDRATTFLEKISCPMGIMVWRKGVLVTAAPEIFYAEDTNGDGRADVRQTLYEGFGVGNHQHRVNHPRWGLDNWVHAGNGDSGGSIRSLKTGDTVDIGGRDLRFRPDEGLIDAQTGNTQFGTNRDDWGNWFGCNNSDPGYLYALADHYLRRNPHVAAPSVRVDVAADRTVYPAGRVISHCDLQYGPPPGWGKPGNWTSLAGVTIYRDDLFGPNFTGNLFVDDSVFNVIHRRILRPDGIVFRGERGPDEQRSEFLATHDIWFRPSTLETGPDGALWVLDFCRYVIEHPEWIADDLEKTLDLRLGSDKGRIYRIYPVDKQPRPIPRLDKLNTAGLVAALDSPNGWQRDMAHQMLLWRVDRAAIKPLEAMATGCDRALARLHAICVLDGLKALRPEIAVRALGDREPGVRRHAVRVSEALLKTNPKVREALLKLEHDEYPHVLLQLAYSLGEWDDPRAGHALGRLVMRHGDDPYLTAAAMSSAVPHVEAMMAEVMTEPDKLSERAELVNSLLSTGLGLNNTTALAAMLKSLTSRPSTGYAAWQFASAAQLLDGLDRQKLSLNELASRTGAGMQTAIGQVEQLFAAARTLAADEKAAVADRLAAMHILGRGANRHEEDIDMLAGLLSPQSPVEVQLGAVETMGHLRDARIPSLLLRGWAEQGPRLNAAIMDILLSRPEWTTSLLDSVQREPKLAAILGTACRDQLLRHPTEAIRRRAEKLFGAPASGKEIRAALANYAPVAKLTGDPVRGKQVFVEATCADCHRLADVGYEMAADLRMLVDKSPGALLIATIDPNRAVEAKYLEYVAITTDGLIRNGVLVEETTASITLADAGGKRYVILRKDLEELVNTGRSRMPEKLEAKLTHQQMADVFAFIAQSGPPRREVAGNSPATVTADPDGSLQLRSKVCEIYAPGVTIGGEHLVWMYNGPNDHVVWSVDVPKTGSYEVWIDWAQVDEYANNPIVVETEDGSSRVTWKLPSTGGWGRYDKQKLGEIQLQAGTQRLRLRPDGPTHKEVSDIRGLHLVPRG
jgi:putative membrane-bound dehydrogenase-like protein